MIAHILYEVETILRFRLSARLRQLIKISCLIVVLCLSDTLYGSSVHALKSLFLFNFINYIQWPAQAFENKRTAILYCVSGNLRVFKNLRSVLKDEYFKKQKLKVRQVNSIQEMKGCQIVFFGASNTYKTGSVLKSLAEQHILTIGEEPGFLAQGGMINLDYINNHVVIEINLHNVKQAQLKISSKLLRLSKVQ